MKDQVTTFTVGQMIEFRAGTLVGGLELDGTWWDLVEFSDGAVVLVRPSKEPAE